MTAAFSKTLGARSLAHQLPDDYSIENVQFEKTDEQLHQAFVALESIQILTDGFFAKSETDIRKARQFQISVESVLSVANLSHLNINGHDLAPSLEALENYSVEAEEKKKSVLKRIWDWIVNLVNGLIARIKKLFGIKRMVFARTGQSLKELIETCGKVNPKAKAEPFGEHGPSGKYVIVAGKFTAMATDVKRVEDNCKKAINTMVTVITNLATKLKDEDHGKAAGSAAATLLFAHRGWAPLLNTISIDNYLHLDLVFDAETGHVELKDINREKTMWTRTPLPVADIKTSAEALLHLTNSYDQFTTPIDKVLAQYDKQIQAIKAKNYSAADHASDLIAKGQTAGLNRDAANRMKLQEYSASIWNAATKLVSSYSKGGFEIVDFLEKYTKEGTVVLNQFISRYKVAVED